MAGLTKRAKKPQREKPHKKRKLKLVVMVTIIRCSRRTNLSLIVHPDEVDNWKGYGLEQAQE